MDQIFLIVSSGDPRIITDIAFNYARKCSVQGWMDKIVVILWGPAQKTIVSQLELKAATMDLVEDEKIQLWASQELSEDYNVAAKLEELGVIFVNAPEKISRLLKEGWHHLTF